MDDLMWMREAVEQAALARRVSAPNPSVGAVVVRDGVCLGRGHTQQAGGPHAEVMAIRDAQSRGFDVAGATLYVTLEPCCHHGKTPPCTELIIAKRIARVVYSWGDCHPLVNGQGHRQLQQAGIEVVSGVGKALAWEHLRGFFMRVEHRRPWVQMKVATTMDGRTALPDGRSFWITSQASRERAQLDRAMCQAIITGVGTVSADNPQMTVRLAGVQKTPLRVILDPEGRIDVNARILGDKAVVVVGSLQAQAKLKAALNHTGADVWCLPAAQPGQLDLAALLQKLADLGVNDVHLEAGAVTLGRFLQADLVDSIVHYMAPTLFGAGLPLADVLNPASPGEATRWALECCERIGDDVRHQYVHPTRRKF